MKRIKIGNFVAMLLVCVLALAGFSCGGNKTYSELTPEQQEKEYAKFQKDSVEICTKDKNLAEAFVLGAFDRLPENNGYFKKDHVDVVYDEQLHCWVGTVTYHVDRNNTYYQDTKVFHVNIWLENNGYAKDAQTFYTVKLFKPGSVENNTNDTVTVVEGPGLCPECGCETELVE